MRKKTYDTKTIHSSKSKALQSPCTGAAFMQSQSSTTYQKNYKNFMQVSPYKKYYLIVTIKVWTL